MAVKYRVATAKILLAAVSICLVPTTASRYRGEHGTPYRPTCVIVGRKIIGDTVDVLQAGIDGCVAACERNIKCTAINCCKPNTCELIKAVEVQNSPIRYKSANNCFAAVVKPRCNATNNGPLGMTSGLITDEQIFLESIADGMTKTNVRLNVRSPGWCARFSTQAPKAQIDFGTEVTVTGVQYGSGPIWDSEQDDFGVSLSNDGEKWTNLQDSAGQDVLFSGAQFETTATARFPTAVQTRLIRLHPISWSGNMNGNPFCVQFELIGCR